MQNTKFIQNICCSFGTTEIRASDPELGCTLADRSKWSVVNYLINLVSKFNESKYGMWCSTLPEAFNVSGHCVDSQNVRGTCASNTNSAGAVNERTVH